MQESTQNIDLQYVIVGLIILGAVIWVIRKLIAGRKHGGSPCHGCCNSQSCNIRNIRKSDDAAQCDKVKRPDCCHPSAKKDCQEPVS